jgi:hypothetical protein
MEAGAKRSTSLIRIVNAVGKLNWGSRACAVFGLCATTAIAARADFHHAVQL